MWSRWTISWNPLESPPLNREREDIRAHWSASLRIDHAETAKVGVSRFWPNFAHSIALCMSGMWAESVIFPQSIERNCFQQVTEPYIQCFALVTSDMRQSHDATQIPVTISNSSPLIWISMMLLSSTLWKWRPNFKPHFKMSKFASLSSKPCISLSAQLQKLSLSLCITPLQN